MILFRDYLRSHPSVAREYEKLKQKLAIESRDRKTYTDLKGPFIQAALQRAKAT
ncbi:GrpB family protein [Alicyclobacillus sp. SP_1]|uniref:GrpB family protein n=1 Tax=Alicyclobacillus sp. SP_1 TaxID=2942475 RepID=UPI0035BE6618